MFNTITRIVVWTWAAKHEDSPSIKKCLSIRDEILTSSGTVELAGTCLQSWFEQHDRGAQGLTFLGLRPPENDGQVWFGSHTSNLSLCSWYGFWYMDVLSHGIDYRMYKTRSMCFVEL